MHAYVKEEPEGNLRNLNLKASKGRNKSILATRNYAHSTDLYCCKHHWQLRQPQPQRLTLSAIRTPLPPTRAAQSRRCCTSAAAVRTAPSSRPSSPAGLPYSRFRWRGAALSSSTRSSLRTQQAKSSSTAIRHGWASRARSAQTIRCIRACMSWHHANNSCLPFLVHRGRQTELEPYTTSHTTP